MKMMKAEYAIYNGNCLEELDNLTENSIDCIITDPPYNLGFQGKDWDKTEVSFEKETWAKCLRVLKPGGFLLSFGGTRTFHRIACAIEDAGFEIRDCVQWIYGSAMPKSLNIGKALGERAGVKGETRQWDGWGSALKPSWEPIIVARKPFKGTLVDNVLEYGVGGLNIDECRVGTETISTHNAPAGTFAGGEPNRGSDTTSYRTHEGRFPANTILSYSEEDKDEVCGGFPDTKARKTNSKLLDMRGSNYGRANGKTLDIAYERGYDDSGSASRYFYCAKASRKDRDEGLDEFEAKKVYGKDQQWGYGNNNGDNFGERIANVTRRNTHPTVKPTSLMQYLVRLVAPEGAIILDPFMGSGSTGKAVMLENKERHKNYTFIGIEQDSEYCDIARARIEFARS